MDGQQSEANYAALVSLACDELTYEELLAMNLAVSLGYNLARQTWYPKVRTQLFMPPDYTTMHDEVKAAIPSVLATRVKEQQAAT